MARCATLRSSGEVITRAIYSYNHAGTSSSVQVGDVYRGTSYPALYRGALFYTDYNKQELRFLTFDAARNVTGSQMFATGLAGMVQVTSDPVSKDLFIMRIQTSGAGATGAIERLRYVAPAPGSRARRRLSRALRPQPGVHAGLSRAHLLRHRDPGRALRDRDLPDDRRAALRRRGPGQRALPADLALAQPGARRVRAARSCRARSAAAPISAGACVAISAGYQLQNEATGTCLTTASSADGVGARARGLCRYARADLQPAARRQPRAGGQRRSRAQQGNVGDNVAINVTASDPDGHALSYRASGLPSGLTINAQSGVIAGQLATIGEHTVLVTVSDGFVETSTSFAFSVVDDRVPVVTVLAPAEGTLYEPGQLITFEGEAVDFEGVPIAAEALSWQLLVHHNQHVHFDGMPPTTGTSGAFIADDHGDNTWLELCLIATDGFGREAEDCRETPSARGRLHDHQRARGPADPVGRRRARHALHRAYARRRHPRPERARSPRTATRSCRGPTAAPRRTAS